MYIIETEVKKVKYYIRIIDPDFGKYVLEGLKDNATKFDTIPNAQYFARKLAPARDWEIIKKKSNDK